MGRDEVIDACDDCLARSWLLGRLASNLDLARGHIHQVLALADRELLTAVAGAQRGQIEQEYALFDAGSARDRVRTAGLGAVCRCRPGYPGGLWDLQSPPAVVHFTGTAQRLADLAEADPVAIVGSRRAGDYGRAVARSLGRGLSAAGVAVVSGMALGADAAAHGGALEGSGATIAVLPAGADRPYPDAKRQLYREIREHGTVVSELPPGAPVRRWMFPARNRLIAALARLTVVVEAGERSGALLTAALARGIGRPLAAVPGHVSSPLAAGPHRLLRSGAHLVQGPEDVLELLFGAAGRVLMPDPRPALGQRERELLEVLEGSPDTGAALARVGLDAGEGLAALAALELSGHVRRQGGGRYVVLP